MPRATITAVGCYAPPRVVTNEELSKTVETNDQWIRDRTGIVNRHIADPDVATSDLATAAARIALKIRELQAPKSMRSLSAPSPRT